MRWSTKTIALVVTLVLAAAGFEGLARGTYTNEVQFKNQQRQINGYSDRDQVPAANTGPMNAQKGKNSGPADGSGNKANRPQDGTGYGSNSGKKAGPQDGTGPRCEPGGRSKGGGKGRRGGRN